MPLPAGVYRADQVGSILRPASIKSARAGVAKGALSKTELRKAEDEHIAQAVQSQLANGLRAITDGEFRRAYFHLDFLQEVGGVETQGQITATSKHDDGFSPPKLVVTGKLKHVKDIQVDDYLFLKSQIEEKSKALGVAATPKVCIPSPTMVHFRGGRASIDIGAYPDLDVFFEDLAKVYQEELDSLYKAGARFVQLDDTNLAYLCDEKMRQQAAERNEDVNSLPKRYAVSSLFELSSVGAIIS
jgi:5-methyltetrahydropteroyltriglutamate--homocysteine methyltransferase